MIYPTPLPAFQETCLSTAKSLPSTQVSTAHIGISDSGATYHFFREKSYFITYTEVTGKFIMMSNGATILVLGIVNVSLTIKCAPVKLVNCYHTPGLKSSLYSLQRHR
jgi:hypothetical protein